jgi:hypothetical protein
MAERTGSSWISNRFDSLIWMRCTFWQFAKQRESSCGGVLSLYGSGFCQKSRGFSNSNEVGLG